MMRLTLVLIATAALAAQGCTTRHEIRAVSEGGEVVFQSRGDGCLKTLTVSLAHPGPEHDGPDADGLWNKAVVWQVEAPDYAEPPCPNRLPIAYGRTPGGMTATHAARPLEVGTAYQVRGWDRNLYLGAFRLNPDGSVDNVPVPVDEMRAAMREGG